MTAEVQPKRSAGGAIVQLIVAIILAGAVLGYSKLQDKLIDKIKWLSNLNMMGVWAAVGLVAFIGTVLWLNGYRGLAKAKGRSTLLGLLVGLIGVIGVVIIIALPEKTMAGEVLGGIGIVGLIILLALPSKPVGAEAPVAEAATPPETPPAEGGQQG